ncbi:hypothetical protein [Priestia megaterium]|uniref:hypothetical protein n=1 Tax=Priestia megaterium TaxID=1404 RepID=UPI00257026B4|nr:hypothetical protein [Priestia megaterium]WJD81364.1 hypothetical protein QRD24_02310 [Priestia megaterium]
MTKDLVFINNQQREELKKAYYLIEYVYENISLDYEEYSIIKTTLGNLKKAIEYEKKYY